MRRLYPVKRWMYRGDRPGWLARVLNRLSALQFSAGVLSPNRASTLEVRGRKTGRLITFPVVIADYEGDRYLVAMLGNEANWVKNVRATGGRASLRRGSREDVTLVEVAVGDRAPILRQYLAVAPGARPHLPVDRDSPLEAFEAVAARYPVFRIEHTLRLPEARERGGRCSDITNGTAADRLPRHRSTTLHASTSRGEYDRGAARRGSVRRLFDTASAVALMVVSPLIRRWHLRWGATAAEVSSAMPGDEVLASAQFNATRAITINAPPEQVWPWIVQVGFRRAGFYSYDLLDNLGRLSSSTVLDEWQHPAVGDLAAPMAEPATTTTSFTIAEIDPPCRLVWSKPDSTWAWRLDPLDGARTRLVTRLKVRYPLRPAALFTVALIEFGDFAMMRRMLQNIAARAQQTAGS